MLRKHCIFILMNTLDCGFPGRWIGKVGIFPAFAGSRCLIMFGSDEILAAEKIIVMKFLFLFRLIGAHFTAKPPIKQIKLFI